MSRHFQLFFISLLILCAFNTTLNAQSDRYLHFDGANDYAVLPDASQYFVGATGISMTGWFCADNPGYGRGYMGFRDPGSTSNEMYLIEIGGSTLECRYITPAGGLQEYVSPAGTVQGNSWQHVAWTSDGTATTLYINGQPIGSTTSNGTFTGGLTDFTIGMSLTTCCNFVFSGAIDEVTVWSKGLSQVEILDMMENELAGTEANLELYYKMNQGIPSGNNTAITTLTSEVGAGTRDAELLNFSMNGATSNFNENALDPSFTVSDFCAGAANQATITGTPGGIFSFQPAPADGATINLTSGEISNGVAGSTYTVRYTTTGPCPMSQSEEVTVLAQDDATFSLANHCVGESTPASISGTAGGSFSFATSTIDGAAVDPATGLITDGIAGTTYLVMYTTTGICPASETQSVSVLDAPTLSNLIETCSADESSYTLSFDLSGGTPSTYVISIGGTLTGTNFVSAPIATGTGYDFIVTDINACDTTFVVGNYFCTCDAAASFSGDSTICPNDEAEIILALEGVSPWSVLYELDGVTQLPLVIDSSPHSLPISAAGTYTFLSVSDANCTSDLSTDNEVIVDLNTAPTGFISGTQQICTGDSAVLDIALTGIGPWTVSYSLEGSFVETLVLTDSLSTISVIGGGEYSLNSVTDQVCSSSGSGSAVVTTSGIPFAISEGALSFCEGTPAYWTVGLTGDPAFEFVYTIDGVQQPPVEAETGGLFEVEISQSGVYELISVTDANCEGTASGLTTVEFTPLPTATILSDEHVLCEGSSQAIEVDVTGEADWIVNYTIDGIPQTAISGTSSPVVLQANEPGEYQLAAVSDDNCTNTAGEEVVDISYYPPIEISVPEEDGSCAGDTVEVIISASGGQGGALNYFWNSSDLVASNGASASFNPLDDTEVTLLVSDDCLIDYSFDIPLNVFPLPQLVIDGPQSACAPGLVELSSGSEAQFFGGQCEWIVAGDTIPQCGPLDYYFDTGIYDVEINVTSAQGCYSELTIENYLQVLPEFTADFSYQPLEVTTLSSEVTFVNQSSGDGLDYFWVFGDQALNTTESSPTISLPSDQGSISYPACLYATNGDGCLDSVCTDILVKNELLVLTPNTFTPNGDGLNDLFCPEVIGSLNGDYRLTIYDRYGQTVFESIEPNEKWIGDNKTNDEYYAGDGLYHWELNVEVEGTTDRQLYSGSVLLIR